MNATILLLLSATCSAPARNDPYFQITVVDEANGRGVPLIELRTVNNLTYYTDSAGIVAFYEPGWMDQQIFFHVRGHGYEMQKDGFGFRGRRLTTQSGGSAVIQVKRVNVAERLYRVTGGGQFVDSQRLGLPVPFGAAPLNAQVIGSDSVQAAVFGGRIHWFWGDTNRPSYPLGNFHVPGATSLLPDQGGLDPSVGVELSYFIGPGGFAKSTCQMPGEGPTWVDGLAVVKDADGRERLFAHYLKVKPPLTVYRQGIAEFLSEKQEFEPRIVFPDSAVTIPSGHSFELEEDGTKYVYFAKPYGVVRVRAAAEAILDPEQYETYSCLAAGSRVEALSVERDAAGQVRYGWKRDTPPLTPDLQQKLVRDGLLKARECLYLVRDVETDKRVRIHHGCVNWNPYRNKWLMITSESFGTSALGEVWYAEAGSPLGPWAYARKIVTHTKQSFYNPRHHPFFNQKDGRVIFFEGTYTHTFSGNDEQTPRYDYNQIMYRLDLDDERLRLPVAVYFDVTAGGQRLSVAKPSAADATFRHVSFFACDRPFTGSLPVYGTHSDAGTVLTASKPADADVKPFFFAWPPGSDAPPGCVPLFEATNASGTRQYLVGNDASPGLHRADQPLCLVWHVPGE